MKDLITAAASLMLLLIFSLQFAGSQHIHNCMFQADSAIETFRDTAGIQGFVSDENARLLTETLAGICGCSEEDIQVESESRIQPEEEGTLFSYRIGYPLKNLIAAPALLGISEEENCTRIEEKGWVVSRYIRKEAGEP